LFPALLAIVMTAPAAEPAWETAQSALRPVIERYVADRGVLERRYPLEGSEERAKRFTQFRAEWLKRVEALPYESYSAEERVDWQLLRQRIRYEMRQQELRAAAERETAPFLPFRRTVVGLEEARMRMEPAEGKAAAETLDALTKQIAALRKSLEAEMKTGAKRTVANRASQETRRLQRTLAHWYQFRKGYDPVFSWWTAEPYKAADKALEGYAAFLREKLAGLAADDKTTIVGRPIGREALLEELRNEYIPYTPEELVEIANREFAWCEREMVRASRELGYGDDWKKALEFVKTKHMEPGGQPALIRKLALEAEAFLDKHDLLTIDPLAREVWRMEMMTPERQLVNPFFLGGEQITVSFPTDTMTHEQKMMSMRGNNEHFSRATVFHELIPGHHLQLFMADRYRNYREAFSTPFFVEGWALYWEMLLWDMKFQPTAADRVGALFWRMHRCARIIFSLSFHLEKMTPQECVDFLVDRVGHERENATAEVRRSFEANYSPLYQAAYMLGGLQIRSLHKEWVESGKMTNRAFHDRLLREGAIPIELMRATLAGEKLPREFQTGWRF